MMPVLDAKKTGRKKLSKLAILFDSLEKKARKIGGADSEDNLQKLQPVVDEMDGEIAEIIGLKKGIVDEMKKILSVLCERRTSRAETATPESISGEVEPSITLPKKPRKQQKPMADKQITRCGLRRAEVKLVTSFVEAWYDYFWQEYIDSMLPNEIANVGTWTKRVLSILEGMGKKLGYSVLVEKPIRHGP